MEIGVTLGLDVVVHNYIYTAKAIMMIATFSDFRENKHKNSMASVSPVP